MATKKTKNDSLSSEQKWGIGVGLTAAAVAATGAYFLYGSKNAEKNRKVVKSWMLKAKADILAALEEVQAQAQTLTKADYEKIVNSVIATYTDVKEASKKDLSDFKKEMKSHWETIEKQANQAAKAAKKSAAKATKRVSASGKKTTKKTSAAKKTPKKNTKKTTKK